MRAGALGVAAVLFGCARAAAPVASASAQATAPASGAELPAAPALVARLREIADALGPRGVRLVGVASQGFIAHNGHATTMLEVPAGQCLSVVSLATPGVHDLDAHLFDPSGDMLVEDVETDAHPTVNLCASEARRVFHVIDAYEGQGAYLVAGFVTDRRGLDEVARVVGGHPGTAGATGGARGELERRVTELRDGIARRGFQPTGDPTRFALSAGGRVRAPFPVTPDRCYTFAAFADGALQDVDLAVLDPSGEEVARDVRRERDGVAQLCPIAAVTLSIEAAGVAGSGNVLLQAWSADAAAIGGANALWLGERTGWSGSAMPLDETVAAGRERLRAMGFTPTARDAEETVRLASGDVITRARTAAAGVCTAVLAAAGRGAGRVALDLHAAEGALVARGAQGEGGALAVACGASATPVQARVGLDAGSGDVRLLGYSAPIPAWASGLDAATVGEAFAAMWLNPAGRWRPRAAPERVRVGGGARVVREVERAEGRCVRAALVAGRGTPSLSAVARSADGSRAAHAVADARVMVARCGRDAERLRVEVATEPSTAPEVDALWMLWDADDAPAPSPR